jgi:hypothetical protein
MAKISKLVPLISILFFILFAQQLRAQNPSNYYVEDPRTFYGGLLFGTNFSQVDGDRYAGYHKAGLNFGGIIYTRLDEDLAMSMELLYSQKGSRGHYEEGVPGTNIVIKTFQINLNYVEIPIQINYFDKRKSHFGAGFSYSKLINSEENITIFDGATLRNGVTGNYPFNKDNVDFLLTGCMHLNGGWFLNLRFQYSITPIRHDVDPSYGRTDQYSNIWALRLMYLF